MLVSILNVTEIIISIVLIFTVLIQNKSVTLNIASMAGGMGPVSKRGPDKVLQNATIALGIMFIVNSLLLFILV